MLVLVSWGPASASPANPIRPIVTYQYQGVAKRNVIKSDHAIVYTTREPPSPLSSERPGRNEQPMLPGSIRVHVDDPRDKSHSVSRIHFGKIYTVEHNVRVRALGMVHKDSHGTLMRQWRTAWNKTFDQNSRSNCPQRGFVVASTYHWDLPDPERPVSTLAVAS